MSERCSWPGTDPLYIRYHDTEWGVPERDGTALWAKLMLDGFQAGLSWITILRKRENFRARFEDFQPARLAQWGPPEIAAALADPGIVRHRGKIEATVTNARAFLDMGGAEPFAALVWDRVEGRALVNHWTRPEQVPAETPLSRDLSQALRARGFRFCGPVVTYAWLQACGVVNDHLTGCPRHAEVQRP